MGVGHVFLAYKGGFGLEILKLCEADIELNIDIVVLMDVNRLDELQDDHFLCGDGAVIVKIGPCHDLIVFLYQWFQRSLSNTKANIKLISRV